MEIIGACMGPEVALINVGATCAAAVAERLRAMDALNPGGAGESRFYVSDSVEGFSRLASTFLQRDVQEAVTQVDIWKYPSEAPVLANRSGLG